MNPSTRREIVLTGYSVVSPIGIGREAYWDSMTRQQSGLGPITQFDAGAYPANIAGEIDDFDPKQYVRPRKSLKVMCRDIQICFAAADLALSHSGLDTFDKDPDRFGVVFGADMMYSPVEEVVDAYKSCVVDGEFQ
ncbi:MAG: beta-ketoacyl synthase N-terminal-like domain-containing protein, partial [Pirellulales bacterium]